MVPDSTSLLVDVASEDVLVDVASEGVRQRNLESLDLQADAHINELTRELVLFLLCTVV